MQPVKLNFIDYLSNEIDYTDQERLKSGFINLDVSIKGFRRSGTYLVAGAEKSGKSSFLMLCVLNFLKQGKKVAVFDTELNGFQFFTRLLAIEENKTIAEVESDHEGLNQFRKKYFDNLFRFDGQKLSKDGLWDFNLVTNLARDVVQKSEVDVLIFDNLTTYQSQDKDSKNMVLPACISQIVTLTKQLKVWSFVVTHLKPDVKVSDYPQKVAEYIKSEEPEKIFANSLTLIRRPTTADIYGGQQALSQLSGTMIVWRPYQEFRDSENLKRYAQIIVTGFRDGATSDCYYNFNEEKVRFMESSVNQMAKPIINSYQDN